MTLTRPELFTALRGMKNIQVNRLALAKEYRQQGREGNAQRLAEQYNEDQIKITRVLKALKKDMA